MTSPSKPRRGKARDVQVEKAADWARHYRGLGYNALPSRHDAKRPDMESFAEYWDRPVPDDVYDKWHRQNVQIMCGTRWKLAVVDCDGEHAEAVWYVMCSEFGGHEPTWKVRTGSGGLHVYFALPTWLDECRSRRLWGVWDTWLGKAHGGDWQKHKEIRLLADGALVIAPPSIHVTTGRAYEFLPAGPKVPGMAPFWLLKMPGLDPPRLYEAPGRFRTRACPGDSRVPKGSWFDREEVLAAIPDKAALAASWGLRLTTRDPGKDGWYDCRSIDRDDHHPSCSFHQGTGVYNDHKDGYSLSFFDLAVQLDAYPHWTDCCNALGAQFVGYGRKSRVN